LEIALAGPGNRRVSDNNLEYWFYFGKFWQHGFGTKKISDLFSTKLIRSTAVNHYCYEGKAYSIAIAFLGLVLVLDPILTEQAKPIALRGMDASISQLSPAIGYVYSPLTTWAGDISLEIPKTKGVV
jgi:hypothetical protein